MINFEFIEIEEIKEQLSEFLKLPNNYLILSTSYILNNVELSTFICIKLLISNWDVIIHDNDVDLTFLNYYEVNYIHEPVYIVTDKSIENEEVIYLNELRNLKDLYNTYYEKYSEEFWQYSEYLMYFPKNENLVILLDDGIGFTLKKL